VSRLREGLVQRGHRKRHTCSSPKYPRPSLLDEAAAALAKYTDRRAYDPEGLYWYGKTLLRLDRPAEARELFERCIEAVKTMPSNRRAQVRTWGSRAKAELRALRR